jgi:hypothetical protein
LASESFELNNEAQVTLANEINGIMMETTVIVNDGSFHVIYFVGERHLRLVVELEGFTCQDQD